MGDTRTPARPGAVTMLQHLRRSRRGATALEYCIIAGAVAVALIAAMAVLAPRIEALLVAIFALVSF